MAYVLLAALVIAAIALTGMALTNSRRLRNREDAPTASRQQVPATPAASIAVADSDGAVHWLVGLAGSVSGKAYLIGQRTMTIGRQPSNLIQVIDDDVSRKHTQIRPRDREIMVVDMSSHNGTFLNGQRVTQATMKPGDTLQVGPVRFRLELRSGGGVDASLERKEADANKFASTISASGKDIADVLRRALEETGGDFDEAGRKLGINPDVLRHLATRRDIDEV